MKKTFGVTLEGTLSEIPRSVLIIFLGENSTEMFKETHEEGIFEIIFKRIPEEISERIYEETRGLV